MTRPSMLRARSAAVALGALCIATTVPASPAAGFADTQGTSRITIAVKDRTLSYGRAADVRGRVAGAAAGMRVTLEHRIGAGAWTPLRAAATGARGRFRVRAVLPGTGAVRVVADASAARAAGPAAVVPAPVASAPARVAVAADVVPVRRRLDVLAGRRASVAGAIRPALAGIPVALQRWTGHGWVTVARSRTRTGGAFAIAARVRSAMSAMVRVRVAGAGVLATGGETVGRLNVFRHALVSWYGPGLYGNNLGCGGRLYPGTLGVAHKTLPCGTALTLRHRGRAVRVRVIDRGPYVGAREFDLTAATKARLGFSGVGSILVTR